MQLELHSLLSPPNTPFSLLLLFTLFYPLRCSLENLAQFIQLTQAGLSVDVPEGDYDALVDVMHHLLAVSDRLPTTDGMFDPLNQTIELLKTYQEEMPEVVYQQLEVRMVVFVFFSFSSFSSPSLSPSPSLPPSFSLPPSLPLSLPPSLSLSLCFLFSPIFCLCRHFNPISFSLHF